MRAMQKICRLRHLNQEEFQMIYPVSLQGQIRPTRISRNWFSQRSCNVKIKKRARIRPAFRTSLQLKLARLSLIRSPRRPLTSTDLAGKQSSAHPQPRPKSRSKLAVRSSQSAKSQSTSPRSNLKARFPPKASPCASDRSPLRTSSSTCNNSSSSRRLVPT